MSRTFRLLLSLACCAGLLIVLVMFSLAQTAPPPPVFTPVTQIGQVRPSGILYDPNFDRLVYVSRSGELTLADARTFGVQHVLYDSGTYTAYQFSPDGRWLALAIDRRIEVWDTAAGRLSATLEPTGANFTQGPLFWSDDSNLLFIETNVPAPAELRRSENDTVVLPWLWDVAAARNERRSVLPGSFDAQPYFNITVTAGMGLAGNGSLIQGLPARVLISTYSAPSTGQEYPVNRIEREPLYLWRSLTDPLVYIDGRDGSFSQLDTRTNTVYRLPLGVDIRAGRLEDLSDALALPRVATRVGDPASGTESALGRLLLGPGYANLYGGAVSVYLLDIIKPYTPPDDPQRRPSRSMLVFVQNENNGIGFLDLITPPEATNLALSPDGKHFAVRRASEDRGLQAVDIYELSSGVIESTILTREPDMGGDYLFSFNGDGTELLVDFQRYAVATGELLVYDTAITEGFRSVVFSETPGQIITLGGADSAALTTWDLATGQPVARTRRYETGTMLYQTETGAQRLSVNAIDQGAEIIITDDNAPSRASFIIPASIPGGDPASRLLFDQIAVSPSWTRFAAVYAPSSESQHSGAGYEYVVYEAQMNPALPQTRETVMLLHFAGDDALPSADTWYFADDETLVLEQFGGSTRSGRPRVYGVDFHGSGLPQCFVTAFPDTWEAWVPVWRRIQLDYPYAELMAKASQVCEVVQTADQLIIVNATLTPTPSTGYVSGSTPAPINIPGVPNCLTRTFRREAYNYAELWRAVTTGLPEETVTEITTMICEGLVTNPNAIQPTPTVDRNTIAAVTATPVPEAPQTVSNDRGLRAIMTVDIASGARAIGDHRPPRAPRLEDVTWTTAQMNYLNELYRMQYTVSSGSLVLNRAGTLAAELNTNGHIVIYRLDRPFAELWADFQTAQQAEAVRAVGLAPTATTTFAAAPDIRPTLTATVTWTPFPYPESTAEGQGYANPQDMCPLRSLRTLAEAEGIAAPGRLWVEPVGPLRDAFPQAPIPWVFVPNRAALYRDPTLPNCQGGGCNIAPGNEWLAMTTDRIQVMRIDGSDAVELFGPEESNHFPNALTWLDGDTLEYRYDGYVPEYLYPITLARRYDAQTQTLSAPFIPWDSTFDLSVVTGELPGNILSQQPNDGDWLLIEMPTGTFENYTGAHYLMYNRATGEQSLFARADGGDGPREWQWRPDGGRLYYRMGYNYRLYAFDPVEKTHRVLGDVPQSASSGFSPDGRYHARWTDPGIDQIAFRQELLDGRLPPKIAIWDTESNSVRRYCIPESGEFPYSETLHWSPDGRYLAFVITLPLDKDFVPTPTMTPTRFQPTATPVPLDVQYDSQFPHMIILDTETGEATIVSREVSAIYRWVQSDFSEERVP